MKQFRLRILSPEGELFAGTVSRLIVRSSGGDLAVLAGHAPMVAVLPAGTVRIRKNDSDRQELAIACGGGLLAVRNGEVWILDETGC